MKPRDTFTNAKQLVNQSTAEASLFPQELADWETMMADERDEKLRLYCEKPLRFEEYTVVYTLYHRMQWLNAFAACGLPKDAIVLEVGSGSTPSIPKALTFYDKTAEYITANMNKELTQGLRRNTANLPVSIQVIEDDANNILQHLTPNSVDAVVFEHSVNDVLQAMLGEQMGLDTTNGDWFELLPQMIAFIKDAYRDGTLEAKLKAPFLSLLQNCLSVLKPGGCFLMSHYMFQYDLDLGYDPDLWQDIIPVIRPWLAKLPGAEFTVDGFDPQWWLFYRK